MRVNLVKGININSYVMFRALKCVNVIFHSVDLCSKCACLSLGFIRHVWGGNLFQEPSNSSPKIGIVSLI